MPTPSVIQQYQYAQSINRRAWDTNYFFDNCQVNPLSSKVGGGAATGTAGDNNVLRTNFGQYEWSVIGTQVVLAPKLDAFGLNLVQSQTNGQGIELCMGQTALSNVAFTTSESNAFFFQAVFKVSAVTGLNPLIIGFRKAAAFNATLSSYTDFAAIGINGNAAEVNLLTQLASGGVTTTDTTQVAANGTIQFAIYVDGSGNVTYQFNYGVPTVIAAFAFAPNTIVIPFIRNTQNATTCVQCSTNYIECGFQS